jgi:hypothetical protein
MKRMALREFPAPSHLDVDGAVYGIASRAQRPSALAIWISGQGFTRASRARAVSRLTPRVYDTESPADS